MDAIQHYLKLISPIDDILSTHSPAAQQAARVIIDAFPVENYFIFLNKMISKSFRIFVVSIKMLIFVKYGLSD